MKQHKLNWVDALVIAVVVLLIAGTCVKFLVLDPTEVQQETVEIHYKLRIATVREYTINALQVGDAVYDDEGKGQVGVITDIQTEPAKSFVSFPNGTTKPVPVEARYDAIVTLQAQAIPDGALYKVGTYTIKANQTSSYFTKYAAWSGRVLAVEGP